MLRFTHFIHLVSWSYNLAVLTSDGYVLFVPASPPGSHSSPYLDGKVRLFYHYSSVPCMPGTYKTKFGFHPCQLCPPQTFNPDGQNATFCRPCHSTSFCPLGSMHNFDRTFLYEISQATAYPSNPEATALDDIVLRNMSVHSDQNSSSFVFVCFCTGFPLVKHPVVFSLHPCSGHR